MNQDLILDAVDRAFNAGICVCPPAQDGSKRPDVASWDALKTIRTTGRQINEWYRNGQKRTGVGWICGSISGGLEVIDFDDRAIWFEFESLAEKSGVKDVLKKVKSGYLEFSPNGAHLVYRCCAAGKNQKLAMREIGPQKKKTLIETRGEGGYIITSPTFGGVNPSGSYTMVSGSIETIATITPEERDLLLDLAKVFDEQEQKRGYEPKGLAVDHWATRPGDEFAQRATWGEILEPHGWTKVFSRMGVNYWRRPEKDHGISATTNHNESDLLYVFSSSTVFEPERGYGKFSAYATLNHGGNFSEAAEELRLLGYGVENQYPEVDLSMLLSSGIDPKKKEKTEAVKTESDKDGGTVPADLLRIPGVVGELAEWINRTAVKPQPVLALGAAIAAMSTIIGRKVASETDLRSNIYILGIAETGSGKEHCRQAVRRVFAACGAFDLAGVDEVASDSSIITRLYDYPSSLFLFDEMGLFLGQINDPNSGAHLRSIKSLFLRLYGASADPFSGKIYADKERNQIIQHPNLSIYGTTVADNFYRSLSSESIQEGLLSRCCILKTDDPDPIDQQINLDEKNNPPKSIVDCFFAWKKTSIIDGEHGDIEELTMPPRPKIIKMTSRAKIVFADFESMLREKRSELRKSNELPALYTRTKATAIKLAMIRACGLSVASPEITEDDAVWSAKLSMYMSNTLADDCASYVNDSQHQKDLKDVYRIICDRGGEIEHSELIMQTQKLTKRLRQEILDDLIDSNMIDVDVRKKTKLSQKSARFYKKTT